tara:strand:+ start:735 stop:1064 length:330 start_codon:yes stop_codon:yes gene_type:complete
MANSSGALFTNRKKTQENHPDFTGTLELSHEVIENLVTQIDQGKSIGKIDLSAYNSQSKKGFQYIKVYGRIANEGGQQRRTYNSGETPSQSVTWGNQPPPQNEDDDISF